MPDVSPIEPATVSLVLSYILQDSPLPPHLISRPLLKRHHFLSLTIDNQQEYLAWPSDGSQEAVTLLLREAQLQNAHDLSLDVRYSADEEALTAHVAVLASDQLNSVPGAPPFRLIFQWDPTDGWQYHNTALMPFPRDSYPTIPDAYAAFASPHDFLAEQTYTVSVSNADDDDDDAYWNSYGQDADEDTDPSSKNTLKAHPDPNSEDAYWARYSSIHGSADSTIPSPLPVKRSPGGVQTHADGRVFVTIPNGNEEVYNPLEPPSPDDLTRRLATLAARPASPPFEDEASSEDSDLAATPDLAPEPAKPEVLASSSIISEATPDSGSSQQPSQVIEDSKTGSATVVADEGDAALQLSIQGLYRLWKLEQQGKARQDTTPEAFITLVHRAIREP